MQDSRRKFKKISKRKIIIVVLSIKFQLIHENILCVDKLKNVVSFKVCLDNELPIMKLIITYKVIL